MPTIYIDNQSFEVKEGQNLLKACLSLGFDLPYFCWHPAMHSAGACRQCAVKQFKDEKDTKGRIVMSCMTPVADGIRISIDDPDTVKFRKSAIEWLMLNHPHDCPVCDEAGECHLQDMTVMAGHVRRRSRFKKRTHRNQYLGPFVNHEMNRCIQCYRCVRFYRDYAGGRDFNVFSCHDHVYFGRHEDGVLQSEFSGNLIEICPTGVFTDKTLMKHYVRKWDLQTAPSVCVHCGLGCNIIPGERDGTLRRILNRYHSEVNGYFICDRGRFGYEFVNSDRRARNLVLSGMKGPTDAAAGESGSKEIVLKRLADLLYFGARVIGIGSPRASLEANFALRTLVGPDRFFPGLSDKDLSLVSLIIGIMQKGPARSPSLHEVETCDAVLVLGEDVTNTAPMLEFSVRRSVLRKPLKRAAGLNIPEWHDSALRDAVQQDRGPLFIASPAGAKLDRIATAAYHAAPDDIARLGFAVANVLDTNAPGVLGLSPEVRVFAENIANCLEEAERPLIISGMGCRSEAVIKAAANIASALCRKEKSAEICFTVPECNTMGLGLMGGAGLNAAFMEAREGKVDAVIILENDLYRRDDKEKVDVFLESVKHVVVADCIQTPTASRAEVFLPSGSFAETDGTLANSEGRAQRCFKVMQPAEKAQEGWRWALDMMAVSERPETREWKSFDDITNALSESLPAFKPVAAVAPQAGFRVSGMKIPRQPRRYSGRTSMHADTTLHEPKPPDDPDSPLSYSMEGYEGIPPSSLIARFWRPGWNSVQAVNKFQHEAGGPLRGGDPGQRLIEPIKNAGVSYFNEVPGPFHPRPGELLILPLYHIFGSEEFSILSPEIAQLAPKPYIALNVDDMRRMQLAEGDEVELFLHGPALRLPVKSVVTLQAGTAGVPCGLAGMPRVSLPSWGKVSTLHKESAQ